MCCSALLKVIMFIINGVVFLVGAGIAGLGVWVEVEPGSWVFAIQTVVKDDASGIELLTIMGYVFIAIGTVLALTGFLGCCGAMMENRCMLLTFFIIVLIIFIVQVAVSGMLLVFDQLISEEFQKIETDIIANIENDYGKSEILTSTWSTTMDKLECCGYNNYTDFTDSPYFNSTNLYPHHCCKDDNFNCTAAEAHRDNIQGCSQPIIDRVQRATYVTGVVGLGLCSAQVFAMIFSMYLFMKAGRKHVA